MGSRLREKDEMGGFSVQFARLFIAYGGEYSLC